MEFDPEVLKTVIPDFSRESLEWKMNHETKSNTRNNRNSFYIQYAFHSYSRETLFNALWICHIDAYLSD